MKRYILNLMLSALLFATIFMSACAASEVPDNQNTAQPTISVDITNVLFDEKLTLLLNGSVTASEFASSAQSDFDVILGFIELLASNNYDISLEMVDEAESEIITREYLQGFPITKGNYTTSDFKETPDGSVIVMETADGRQFAVTAYNRKITGAVEMNAVVDPAYEAYQENAAQYLNASASNSGSRDYPIGDMDPEGNIE
jgi:hypothetical protein